VCDAASGGAPQPPFSVALLSPSFVLAGSAADVAVFDAAPAPPQPRPPYGAASPPRRPGPRLVLSQRVAALAAPFSAAAAAADALPFADDDTADADAEPDASGGPSRGALLAAAPRGSLLLLSLGHGAVGVFENALLPPTAGPASQPGRGSAGWAPRDLWSQPLFVIVIILLAWWQFQRAAGGTCTADVAALRRRRPTERDYAPDFDAYAAPTGAAAGRAAVAAAAAGLRGGATAQDGQEALQRAMRALNSYAASDAARQ
jgi:hypothetical protein